MSSSVVFGVGHKVISYRYIIESDREVADIISAPIRLSCTARGGYSLASTTTFWDIWFYWRDPPPVQSDQLCSIGADMMSATSLSLSIYNLLLYEHGRYSTCKH